MSRTTALATVAVGVSLGLAMGCSRLSEAESTSYTAPPVGSYSSAPHEIVNGDKTASVTAATVTPEFFSTATVQPMLGRSFTTADYDASSPRVALLSYDLWQRVYGRAPDIIGRTIQIDGRPFVVVGVMPRGFEYPKGADMWMPK
jgi:hypothetical protein